MGGPAGGVLLGDCTAAATSDRRVGQVTATSCHSRAAGWLSPRAAAARASFTPRAQHSTSSARHSGLAGRRSTYASSTAWFETARGPAQADATAPVAGLPQAVWDQLGLNDGAKVRVSQADGSVVLPARLDAGLAARTVRVPAGHPDTAALGAMFGAVAVEKA